MDGTHQRWLALSATAEERYSAGDTASALRLYLALLEEILSSGGPSTGTELHIVERCADLGALYGLAGGANELWQSAAQECARSGNIAGSHYLTLKRILLYLDVGEPLAARDLLDQLSPAIGPLAEIDVTPSGLPVWEAGCYWETDDGDRRAVLFSRLYLAFGRLLSAGGQYGPALCCYARGLFHARPDGTPLAAQAYIPLQLAAASARLEFGDFTSAAQTLSQGDLRPNLAHEPSAYVRRLELLGHLNLLQGRFGSALEHLGRVVEACRERGFRAAELRGSLNLAGALILLNQTARARDLLDRARSSAEISGDTVSAVRASELFRLAEARARSLAHGVAISPSVSEMWVVSEGIPEAGAPKRVTSPEILSGSTGFLASFDHNMQMIQWSLAGGQVDRADSLLEQLEARVIDTDSRFIAARLRVVRAEIGYYRFRKQLEDEAAQRDDSLLAEAATALEEACCMLRDMGARPELWQVQRLLGWCWTRLGRAPEECNALAVETARLLESLAGSLSGSDRAIFLLNKWTADEEDLARCIGKLEQLKRLASSARGWKRLTYRLKLLRETAALALRIDHYKDSIADRTFEQRQAPESAGPTAWWKRVLTHPRDRITLAFLVLPDRLLVIRSGWLTLDFGISPITRIQIRELIRQWHEEIRRGSNEAEARIDRGDSEERIRERGDAGGEIIRSLAASLQLPDVLSGLPRRIRALTFVPDDSLHGCPFAAMLHGDRYLIERYALSVAFRSWETRGAAKPRGRRYALTVGVSMGTNTTSGLGAEYRSLAPLPGVERELNSVEQWLTGLSIPIRRLHNAAATQNAVAGSLRGACFAHFACHGVFRPDRPDRSGIVLVPEQDRIELISLRDLWTEDLRGLRHMTLSSCWLADSFILPGRWIISLPETLWRAGVESVLGSLWPVNDKVAVAFMERFYSYLDRLPRDEALRRTQLDCLRNQLLEPGGAVGGQSRHLGSSPANGVPLLRTAGAFYWAGFNLYGTPKRLDL